MKKSSIIPYLEWPDKTAVAETTEIIPNYLHNMVYPRPSCSNFPEPESSECRRRPANKMTNRLLWGDNLSFLQALCQQGYEERVHLIYVDPPYFSQTNYESQITVGRDRVKRKAFHDRWAGELSEYLNMLYPRLKMMRKILRSDGSIFIHVDWHCSHYIRMLLDEVFGRENFINEIVWCYGGGGSSDKHFLRKHDMIYWYGKSNQYTYNQQFRPYTAGTLQRGLTRVKGNQYKLRAEGAGMQDWWTDIPKILSPTARENMKYPTQKPKELIKRIIESASNPGDLVADFFGGSGTVAEICNELGRSWILCDNGNLAYQTMLYRLIQSQSSPFTIEILRPKNNENTIGVKFEKQSEPDGSSYVNLSIASYQRSGSREIIQGRELAECIEFWEIDLHHDNQVFQSDIQMIREKKRFEGPLPLDIIIHQPTLQSSCIAIRLHDIWAEESTVVLNI